MRIRSQGRAFGWLDVLGSPHGSVNAIETLLMHDDDSYQCRAEALTISFFSLRIHEFTVQVASFPRVVDQHRKQFFASIFQSWIGIKKFISAASIS